MTDAKIKDNAMRHHKPLITAALLAALAPALPDVGSLDYETLIRRAVEQRERAEGLRLRAAQAAFAGASSSAEAALLSS